MMHGKICADEIRIRQVEFHRLFGCGINADPLGHLPVIIFKRAHTVSRMHIQRDFEPTLVQIAQQRLVVGEQLPVPRVSGPAGAILRVDVVDTMPVHVDHGCGERNAFAFEPVHEIEVLVLGIPVVAAPPVAERETRQQRRRPGESVEVLYCFGVASTIAEEVQVGFLMVSRRDPCAERIRLAVSLIRQYDHIRRGIIEYRPAVSRNNPISQRDLAICLVKRARGAFEIMFRFVSVMPSVELGVGHAFDDHAQPFFAERFAVIRDVQVRGVDDEQSVAMCHRESRCCAEITADDHLRGIVLEFAGI